MIDGDYAANVFFRRRHHSPILPRPMRVDQARINIALPIFVISQRLEKCGGLLRRLPLLQGRCFAKREVEFVTSEAV
jgi:hypothetical protein